MTDQSHIHVSLPALAEIAGELEDILRALDRRLEELYRRTEAVVVTWKGEARTLCVDELDKWDAAMQDMQAAQKWLHEVAVTGHADCAAAHRAVLRGWRAA